ncbi:ANTAR domain-containing protein [Kribbella sp. NPDC051620]|uniref:ANTAR domain-containing protein n=1 Tax=Kribbella sp. NPDC051620 TaxID=3364120 RepID=UPI00379DC405
MRTRPDSVPGRFRWLADSGPALRVEFDFVPGLLTATLRGNLDGRLERQLRRVVRDAVGWWPDRMLVDATVLAAANEQGLATMAQVLTEVVPDSMPTAVAGLEPDVLEELTTRRPLTVRAFPTRPMAVAELLSLPATAPPSPDLLIEEVRHLRRALASRADIDQAKGILMIVYGLNPDAAFALLTWHSRNGGLAVRDLARRLVSAVHGVPATHLTPQHVDHLLAALSRP